MKNGFLFTLLVFSSIVCNAQILSNNRNTFNNTSTNSIKDSSQKKHNHNDSVTIYYTNWKNNLPQKLDTTIDAFHWYNRNNNWSTYIGQFGTPEIDIRYNPAMNIGFNTGLNTKRSYFFTEENTKFYNTTRPYTVVDYFLATKQNQQINVLHTQNIKPTLNYSTEYNKLSTPGFFKLHKSNHDNARATVQYKSINQQYEIKTAFLFNKIQQDENGGIINENELLDPKSVKQVLYQATNGNRSSITNFERDIKFNFQHSFSFGKKDSIYSKDSSQVDYVFTPGLTIQHKLLLQSYIYKYRDIQPDKIDYAALNQFSFNTRNDSVVSFQKLTNVGNEISLKGNVAVRKKYLQGELGIGNTVETQRTFLEYNYSINNYVFAQFTKPIISLKEWQVNAEAKIYFTGRYKGNFLINAFISKQLPNKLGILSFSATQSNNTQSYFVENYTSNYYIWNNNFKNQQTTKIEGIYRNPTYRFSASITNYLMSNFIYWDTLLKARQNNTVIPLQQILVSKELVYKKIHFYNDVLIQIASDNNPIHVPKLSSRHRLAIETSAFKGALQFATGVDVKYNSPYLADNYAAQIYQFTPQYTRIISNSPQVGIYFATKVNKFRASIMLDEVQQKLASNRLMSSFYPASGMYFKLALSWVFIN
jgi:hypothetical protein